MADTRGQMATGPSSSWTWPIPPRSNRFGATVTEVMDTAAEGRLVAVIEGVVWPPVGGEISLWEDAGHLRRGAVSRVELVLDHQRPARVVIWASLERETTAG